VEGRKTTPRKAAEPARAKHRRQGTLKGTVDQAKKTLAGRVLSEASAVSRRAAQRYPKTKRKLLLAAACCTDQAIPWPLSRHSPAVRLLIEAPTRRDSRSVRRKPPWRGASLYSPCESSCFVLKPTVVSAFGPNWPERRRRQGKVQVEWQ
jgi:hypothetical protein